MDRENFLLEGVLARLAERQATGFTRKGSGRTRCRRRRKLSFATRAKPRRAGVPRTELARVTSGARRQDGGALSLTLFRNAVASDKKKQDVKRDLTCVVSEAGYHRSLSGVGWKQEGNGGIRSGQRDRMSSAGGFGRGAVSPGGKGWQQQGRRGETSEQKRRCDSWSIGWGLERKEETEV